jgi:transcriptional regulator with XRE-family HTH domain
MGYSGVMSTEPEAERGQLAIILIRARKAARLSQRDLATLSGVSLATIRDIELGEQRRPKPDTIGALARGLTTRSDGSVSDQHLISAYSELMATVGYGVTITGSRSSETRFTPDGLEVNEDVLTAASWAGEIEESVTRIRELVSDDELRLEDLQLLADVLSALVARVDQERAPKRTLTRSRLLARWSSDP